MTPNAILLHKQINALSSHHQRASSSSRWGQTERPEARHYMEKESKLEVSIKSLFSELRESWDYIVRGRRNGGHQKNVTLSIN